MKLSFSLPSKPKSKPTQQPEPTLTKPEFLTEFNPNTQNPQYQNNNNTNIIIPPIENEWRPSKKMKNLNLPSLRSSSNSGTPLEFEPDNMEDCMGPTATAKDEDILYGLNLRENNNNNNNVNNDGVINSVEGVLLKKLKSDMERLPEEEEGFEGFEEVPVDGFGAALLRGYGWVEGRGIGRNAKEDVKPVEYSRRAGKEGLGFSFDEAMPKKGKGERFGVGVEVRVVGGRDVGRKGKVVEVGKDGKGGETILVRLEKGRREEKEVKVSVKEVVEVGSVEEERCLKELREMRIGDESRGERKTKNKEREDGKKERSRGEKDLSSERAEGKRGRDEGRRESRGEKGLSREKAEGKRGRDEGRRESKREKAVEREEKRGDKIRWLKSHIRVKVVSKKLKGGRFYLKKGEIVDVVGPTTCDISMDDGKELVQGVEEDMLETAVPKRGGPVLVLYGKHEGVYGSLVERDSVKEAAVVEHADTKELLLVRFEQIAEYTGDPSILGY